MNYKSRTQNLNIVLSRYWGNSYPRLLKIKNYWDPANFFRHCHSVGSTNEDCCPYDKAGGYGK